MTLTPSSTHYLPELQERERERERERTKTSRQSGDWNNFHTKKSDLGGHKQKTFEYWDINNLIYNTEEKLLSLKYPVHNIVVIYLAGGSDFTEK